MKRIPLMVVCACALLGHQVTRAAAQFSKWYVFQTGGIARIDSPGATPLLDGNADAFVDSEIAANGLAPGQLNSSGNRSELQLAPGVTAQDVYCLSNNSPTYDAYNSQYQGYHYAQFLDFEITTQLGVTNSLYMVVRKGDAGGANSFQADMFLGWDRSTPLNTERNLEIVPYNLAKASAAFRSILGSERLTALWTSADGAGGNVVPVPNEYNPSFTPAPRRLNLYVPAPASQYQLVKISVFQGATSATISSKAYKFTNFADLQDSTKWVPFAAVNPVAVAGLPGSKLVPYFSSTTVPNSAGVDNAIFAIRVE